MAQMPRGQAGPWLRAPGACRGCCHPRILPRERETRPGPSSASKQQILVRVEDPQLTDGCYELGWLWGVVGPLEPGPQGPRAPSGAELLACRQRTWDTLLGTAVLLAATHHQSWFCRPEARSPH